MTTKKDPARFTVRFNLNDPVHREAVAYLEHQGARSKANYLANAVLYYKNAAPKSMDKAPQGLSRPDIEAIVLEILARWKSEGTSYVADTPNTASSEHQQKLCDQDVTRGLISDALAAFQGG